MSNIVTPTDIDNCLKETIWDLGNKVLYDLCSNNFTHDTPEKVIAKTLLIGRVYAAAIERRKNKSGINDNFYIDTVAPAFRNSRLDTILAELKKYNQISVETLPHIVNAHYFLTQLLFTITKLEKRSFSSKYLHFHLPELFFIYDSRAVAAMRYFVNSLPKDLRSSANKGDVDKEYSSFVYKCVYLRELVNEQHGILLTPRQLDILLIQKANSFAID